MEHHQHYSTTTMQQHQQPTWAEAERNTLKNLAYHLRDQARLLQHNLPEDLEQYRSLGTLFDMVSICEEAQQAGYTGGKEDPRAALQRLFWRAVELRIIYP